MSTVVSCLICCLLKKWTLHITGVLSAPFLGFAAAGDAESNSGLVSWETHLLLPNRFGHSILPAIAHCPEKVKP